jgi:hypothetical protein
MRGKIAWPFSRIGDEFGTVGVPEGSAVGVVGGEDGVVWLPPGGAAGVRTKGELDAELDDAGSAAAGTAVAAGA